VGTQEELQDFLRQNKAAWQFASKASDDYLLARFGMLNTLWSSFEMATQATEKLLKAYLLFTDRTLFGSAKKVQTAVQTKARSLGRPQESGHNVEACLELAAAAGFVHSVDLKSRLIRINSYYGRRYPDGNGPPWLSAEEVHDLDEAVFEIWDAFQRVNSDYHCVSGLMSPIYAVFLEERAHGGNTNPLAARMYKIMTQENKALELRWTCVRDGTQHCLNAWGAR
jgi:hypothetical protein